MAYNSTSKVTIQQIVDEVKVMGEFVLLFNTPGSTDQPGLGIANDVISAICATPVPWKWNETSLPPFYTNPFQQDYALITSSGASVMNVEWLERGAVFNINNPTNPKQQAYVECGRQLPQSTGNGFNGLTFKCNMFPNQSLYYGTWGQANTGGPTLGNNPVAGSVYTSPFGNNTTMPKNPIMQIIDANGNFLVLTGFGTEGSAAPLAAANAVPGVTASGVGATTIWTVVDPNGTGVRILGVPGQTGVVWQFNLVGQMPPPIYTDIKGTLAPFPDKYKTFFKAGFIAQAYRYSPLKSSQAKFDKEWALWLRSMNSLRELIDTEQEENSFVPARTVMGSGGSRGGRYLGGAQPFGPVYPGQ